MVIYTKWVGEEEREEDEKREETLQRATADNKRGASILLPK